MLLVSWVVCLRLCVVISILVFLVWILWMICLIVLVVDGLRVVVGLLSKSRCGCIV